MAKVVIPLKDLIEALSTGTLTVDLPVFNGVHKEEPATPFDNTGSPTKPVLKPTLVAKPVVFVGPLKIKMVVADVKKIDEVAPFQSSEDETITINFVVHYDGRKCWFSKDAPGLDELIQAFGPSSIKWLTTKSCRKEFEFGV